ncbi:hypothetical protein ACH5RR_018784 [Cinchona calisaya]|uniref:Uncharacterized protein n=1 Tax=Cinchona calisaya TaxID=153742 RepID=A0ABD2ZR33_9GENT
MVWDEFEILLDIPRVQVDTIHQKLNMWRLHGSTTLHGHLVEVIPSIILWNLWLARVSYIFNGLRSSSRYIVAKVWQDVTMISLSRPFVNKPSAALFPWLKII